MLLRRTSKLINIPNNNGLYENPQLNIVGKPEHKPFNSSRKRKIFPDDSTGIVLRLKKKLFPNLKLSANASVEIDNFIKDYVESFEFCLRNLTRYKKPKTLTIHELECATRLILPPELAKRAVVVGDRAVLKAQTSSRDEFRQPSDVSKESVEKRPTSSNVPRIRKKKSGLSNSLNFGTYILNLKKLLHPDLQISKESVSIVNSFLVDVIAQFQLFLRILSQIEKRRTLSVHVLECATKLCLPPVLAECAKEYGKKAVKTAHQQP